MVLEKDAVDMFKDIPSPEQIAELEAKLPLRFEYKYQRKEEVSYICNCEIPESSWQKFRSIIRDFPFFLPKKI